VTLGFNKTPTSLTLQEPQGTWTLQAASWQREFGGQANDHPPDIIIIPSEKTFLSFPTYGVAVYVGPHDG
jgi:hypothetical protein